MPVILLFTILLSCSWPALAGNGAPGPDTTTAYIATSGNAALDNHITKLLQKNLGETISLQPYGEDHLIAAGDPVITIGPTAFARVRQENRSRPILALLVERGFIKSYAQRSPGQVSAIYYDAPLLRQALTGKAILPQSRRIALLATTETAEVYEDLMEALTHYNLEARVFIVDEEGQLIPTLVRALSYGDFLLAGPDDAIYNPRSIKHILLTTYRRNRIVIGPNQAYVKAGVLASSYAPFTEIAAVATDFLQHYRNQGEFPEPDYPKNYKVAINQQVARSLNIPVPEQAWIAKRVHQLSKSAGEESE